ncbi:flagellar biosynthesis anti-sigma factor FlgM [Thermosipho melanesiensis]|uniref:Negative regulator of flagellin synthesis n=2 Tax=Thermosipho melanesiensis TaxID=46541 RepID=A6LJU5_THEM4|nr:flagellar biosynthesis anti-sigma factor FlgM [Thermosipho melanesiensis]ABR30196.1 putative anti-sigma-28 factor, FlgM [Thermosipho melanesiensis BI429]APT73394.1 flagellar biosynthesis anti-sigma factor FlgM [Thermosipho melanesiensis]OOC38208.1 flagellar biosynthesis anti-sigma factor FlgM [Thermosipho melanesiensis]OOC40037.1 flagellar biosynthesis anti-sigma factor FlgM [Thermosipho melanesiensis]OOC40057.1 flagellar biosynthesis anti-sigma factor FlgM [Thermosipho melanesiensis]
MDIKKIGGYGYIQGINKKHIEKINRKDFKASDFSSSLEIKKLLKDAKEIPEVRQELVDKLKDAIKNGTFKVDPEKIAKSILGG